MAATEHNCTTAWAYINTADVLQLKLVPERSFVSAVERMQRSDKRVPFNLRKLLLPPLPDDFAFTNENRHLLIRHQRNRAFVWNLANCRITLKFRLWRRVGLWLLLSLILAIYVIENFIYKKTFLTGGIEIYYPFLCIAILGFFGGAISAHRQVPQYAVNIPSAPMLSLLSVLRMLLGSIGAIV